MSNKKLYLHIGSGKTGSSYLQNILFTNKDALKNHGYVYPTVCLSNDHSHNKLFLSALEGNVHFPVDYALVLDSLKKISENLEDDSCRGIIMSSECLPFILKNIDKFSYFSSFFKKFGKRPVISTFH
jgi:hypothetical protein